MSEPYRLRFDLPGLPPLANRQARNWRAAHQVTVKWKGWTILMCRSFGIPLRPLPEARLTLVRWSSVEPDYDGLVHSFKPVIDGLREAGVIENDRPENIGVPAYLWMKCGKNLGKISVEVKSI